MRKPSSLRAQAVTWLSQREHSARELRVKLRRRLEVIERRAMMENDSSLVEGASSEGRRSPRVANRGAGDGSNGSHENQVDEVIDWLLALGYLDEQRFVASRVHVRSGRFGVARIEQELSHHGLDLPPGDLKTLRSTELERALAVWQRRFGSPPIDMRDAARQARFLAGRGFSSEVVRRVVPRLRAAVDPDKEPG